eukprot:6209522-Pleurochrysis_carterae.AAC.2
MALLVPSWDDGLELPALLRKRQKDLFALLEDTRRIRRERQAQLAHLNKQLKQVRLEIDLEKQYQTSLHDGTRALQMAKTQQELVDVTNQFESEVNRQKSLAGQLHGRSGVAKTAGGCIIRSVQFATCDQAGTILRIAE